VGQLVEQDKNDSSQWNELAGKPLSNIEEVYGDALDDEGPRLGDVRVNTHPLLRDLNLGGAQQIHDGPVLQLANGNCSINLLQSSLRLQIRPDEGQELEPLPNHVLHEIKMKKAEVVWKVDVSFPVEAGWGLGLGISIAQVAQALH